MHHAPHRLLLGLTLLSLVGCGESPAPVSDTDATSLDTSSASLGCIDPADTPPPEAVLQRRFVRNAMARGAVCNDGSPAAYYVRRGVGCGTKRWVLHLEGGGACYPPGCPDRSIRLMSSKDDPETMTDTHGLLSNDPVENPDFFTANQVFFSYCSSDAYSGDKGGTGVPGDFHFRGSRIVQAVVEDLVNPDVTPSPNLAQGTEVLLAGGSAGGAGVLYNLDRLSEAFPSKRVRGFSDAGWNVDMLHYDPPTLSTVDEASGFAAFWNSVGDASCSAANPTQLGRCGVGETLFPYLTTPVFIRQDQLDPVKLESLGLTDPYDSSEQAYALSFAARVRSSLAPVPGVFSPADQQHTVLWSVGFNKRLINGVSVREALGNWYFARSGPSHLIE
ncbi:hypothetical protein JY651_33415 [Pyxidicoccus parkwayensis]|uniref:Pectinacetylesterase n=1 Tax=Pyxidicoccus parkwayensis TaxID=2813578 RepID=A0ABX7NMQ9_9BACT|nr:pectin acetylesterase-family hydrolase [Pyxidicoccus parkwaysis]QSQ20145.1 hypothetical protein JY651_33415 [Pyxidicoccus parkwaysis]